MVLLQNIKSNEECQVKRDKLVEFVLVVSFIAITYASYLGFNVDLILGLIISVSTYACWLIDLKMYLLWKKNKLNQKG